MCLDTPKIFGLHSLKIFVPHSANFGKPGTGSLINATLL